MFEIKYKVNLIHRYFNNNYDLINYNFICNIYVGY